MKGDGIGPEVVDSMLKVLKECNLQSELILCDVGSEQWDKNGRKDATYIPDATMKSLEETDCCFKGPTTTIPVPGAPRSANARCAAHHLGHLGLYFGQHGTPRESQNQEF